MKCPYCGNIDTRVIDSRPADDGTTIRRRRSCDACNKRFTTYEKVETIPLIVIKKDNNREQYDRTKLEGGVLRACYKRPVSAADIQETIDSIETAIFSREEKEIPSRVIGELVMDKLKNLPHVKEVRGMGLMIGVEFDDTIDAVDVKHGAFDRKLLITAIGGHTIRMVPPLIASREDCDKAYAILEETVKALS